MRVLHFIIELLKIDIMFSNDVVVDMMAESQSHDVVVLSVA